MVLQDILKDVAIKSLTGRGDLSVENIQIDSRQVSQSSCFIAIKGTVSDGHDFIDKAIEKGAVAIVCEVLPKDIKPSVTYVEVGNSSVAAGMMAHHFY